jgi:CheY-like chemotaxis protein
MLPAMANVLVVDDNVHVARATERALTVAGHAVRTAATGLEGLRVLQEQPLPDCVVLDVEMPELSGPGMVYEMFRHDAGLETVPIVLVSGRGDVADVAARVGTPYYLSKGESHYSQELLALVARALSERSAPVPGS